MYLGYMWRLWIFNFHHWFRLGHSNKVIFWCLGFMWLLSCISSYWCTSRYLCYILILLTIWIWILFLPGLTIQANTYHKMLIGWTSQKIKDTYSTHNAFDFKNGDIFIYKVLWNFKILFHEWSHIYAWNNNHQAFFPLVGTGGSNNVIIPSHLHMQFHFSNNKKNVAIPLFCYKKPCVRAFLWLEMFFIFNSLYS